MKVIERSEGRYMVESESRKGTWHLVKKIPEGWSCNCESGIYRNWCRHIETVKLLNLPEHIP